MKKGEIKTYFEYKLEPIGVGALFKHRIGGFNTRQKAKDYIKNMSDEEKKFDWHITEWIFKEIDPIKTHYL